MSTLLEDHMKTRRMLQACDTSQLGPPLPDDILSQFTAAISSDDLDAIHTLLDQHFPDRSKVFPGTYKIQELFPALSQAARHDQTDVLQEIFIPYPHPFNSFDFVAREAIDTCSKNTLLLLLDHGWDINGRIDRRTTVLETFLYHSTPDRDSQDRRDMAYWLIDHGAGLNERPRHMDTTGMSYAVERASVDFVRELLDHRNGDVRKGQLLHHALRRRRKNQDDCVEMLSVLLELGAQLNTVMYADDEMSFRNYWRTDLGTPLHDAAKQGHVEAVKYLLAQGADTSILSSRTKQTALEVAEKAGHDDIVAILQSPDQHRL